MRWQALSAAAFVLLAGCGLVHDLESHMTYDEARRQVFGLVEGSLTAGLEGRPPPSVEPLVGDSPSCADAWGVPIVEEVQPGVDYSFSIEHLGEDPDVFVDVVERFWRQRGYAVTRDDLDPGVPSAFAVVEGDFNLEVFVNHDTGEVLVGGTGPCVASPTGSSSLEGEVGDEQQA